MFPGETGLESKQDEWEIFETENKKSENVSYSIVSDFLQPFG